MYNFLLDPLPDEFEGYLIRTDYRIGIQISQILGDPECDEVERLVLASQLLFGAGVPDYETAIRGLQWFVAGGEEDKPTEEEEGENINYFSFDADAGRIYSGFRRAYGIDIDRERMHWFRFLRLFGDLGECAYTQVIDFRTADLSKMDKDTRAAYMKMRRKFALPQPKDPDEEKFMAALNGGDGNGE
ncbi:bacteriophage Gp15 family protein [Acetanaerobacterium sp. MSJ-12]|uniref:Bacteriophage Gp15 protein n=1 Tax=Bittarella massiliensis (ex Durand et al. 2017) TaxID=1720313 RepID=A0ABW9WW17_9FIRM|nr:MULTISPECIES: Gp15 family bacteriophage protein [Oscillospiraceae]MBU5419603.1 bacteriophage Gp15 family protein [Acetanaerobacterium sp. MSJ-12]MZL69723.1 hypothetical protein [Bittarella massiliensis (ex Durand et al. 2017)]MZL80805.1 hypothetical protein [Bittarella massiliensis (ex Durand et al. 2017)]